MKPIKNTLRKLIFARMSPQNIDLFYKIYYRLRYPDEMSTKKKFGEKNPGIAFYVIRPRKDCIEGLMSLFMNVAKNIYYAKEHGYEPIVDFENYKTQYMDALSPHKNVWENYFTQPTKYTLDEVYQSQNVLLSGLEMQWYKPLAFDKNFSNDSLRTLHDLIFTAIDFSDDVVRAAEAEVKKLHLNPDKTLGLYLRGTDYIALKPAGHPVQPTVEDAIPIIDEFIEKYKLETIFLVTEDGAIHKQVVHRYGELCSTPTFDTYVERFEGTSYLSDSKSISELGKSPSVRGLNYLVKLYILANCSYFVGGNTMGSWAACCFSQNGFLDKYVFDLGVYGK